MSTFDSFIASPKDLEEQEFGVLSQKQKTNLKQFGLAAQTQLRAEAAKLMHQRRTTDNIRNIRRVQAGYERLIKILDQHSSEENDKIINNFVSEESQRIKLFGSSNEENLNVMLQEFATNARKHNLMIATKENEIEAWDVIQLEKAKAEKAIFDEDHNKTFESLGNVDNLIDTYIAEDIIGLKRANLYRQSIKDGIAEKIISNASNRADLLVQTEGTASAEAYLSNISDLFGDYIKKLSPDVRAEWIQKRKGFKIASKDLSSLAGNFQAIENNLHSGYTNIESFIQAGKNLETKTAEAVKLKPDSSKLKSAYTDIQGRVAMASAIKNELYDINFGSQQKFELLNPNLTPPELQAVVMGAVGSDQTELLESAFDFRAKFLERHLRSAKKRDDIFSVYESIVKSIDQTDSKSPIKILRDVPEGSLDFYSMIKNDIRLSDLFGVKRGVSQKTSNRIKDFINKPQNLQNHAVARSGFDRAENEFGISLKDIIIKYSSENKAYDLTNPTATSFIENYGIFFSHLGSDNGYQEAVSYMQNMDPDFSALVTRLNRRFGSVVSGDANPLFGNFKAIAEFSGYDVATIANSYAIDTALGMMNGTFGYGAKVFRNLDNKSAVWATIEEHLTKQLENFSGSFAKIGRTPVINSDTDIFSSRTNVDRAILGVFDKPLSETGIFERSGERVKQLFTSKNVIRNLIPAQQKRVEGFLANLLPGAGSGYTDVNLSGRLRIFPASNSFYQVMIDNGFGGLNPLMWENKPVVINPEFYSKITGMHQNVNLDDDKNHSLIADILIEILTISNGLPRTKELGNL